MPHLLRLFNQGGNISSFIASMFLAQMLVNTFLVLYALAIRVIYGIGRLRGTCVKLHCKWKPQLHAVVYHLYTTLCSAISLIYHSTALLIFTSSVVHLYTRTCTLKSCQGEWKPYHLLLCITI